MSKWLLVISVLSALATAVLGQPVQAANPTTVSFQGKVVNSNGTNVTDGTYTFVFKLYTVASGGSAIWTETDSLTVAAGVFQVNLGAGCSFFVANACNGSTPIDFNANPALYLGITFNSDPAGEMTPRVQLQSVPYAYNADKVGGLSSGQLVQLSPGSQQSGNVNVSSVISPSLTSTGALTINSGAATNVSIDSAGAGTAAINIGGTNATSVGLSRTGQTTTVNGALVVNQNATLDGSVIMTFSGTEDLAITSDLAGTVNGLSFIGTPSATAGTTNGAFIQQANSANANGLDNGVTIDNADTNTPIGAAINVTNSGGGGYTNILSSPVLTIDGNGNIIGSGLDYFDPGGLTGASTTVGTGGGTNGNFGGVLSTGANLWTTDSYAQEFIGAHANTTTNDTNVGDDGLWYFNNNAQVAGSVSDVSTDGGALHMAITGTTNRGVLVTQGVVAGTQDKPWSAPNLPIVQMKARVSALRATDDLVFGLMDTATATVTNNALPTNGIVFWTNNSTGATGWQGVVRSGGATIGTPVTCPGNVSAGNYATGRIVVVNATTVRFFMDVNATDGVNLVDCGTVTGALPAADLAMGMYLVQTVATATNVDLDYARAWQDDSPPASADAASDTVAAEQTEADISTGGDEAAVTDPIADAQDQTAITLDDDTAAGSTVDSSSSPTAGLSAAPGSDGMTQLEDENGTVQFAFDSSGDASLNGNLSLTGASLSGGLSVGGDVNVAGLSSFQKLATFLARTIFRQDVEFDGHLTVGSDTAGYAKLRKNEISVHVAFAKPYDNPPVVSANAIDGQFAALAVNNITTQGFDITLQNPATADLNFSWTAVGVSNPQTASNPVAVPATAQVPLTN